MILDIIGLTIIVLSFIRGYMKGMIVSIFSLLAIILGVVCSLKLSGKLAEFLLEKGIATSGWVQLISYIILFVAVLLIVRLIARALEKTMEVAMLGWLNGLIGGLLSAFVGAVFWSSILWIGNRMHLIAPETIEASKTWTWFEPIAPWTFEHIGRLLPFAKDIFKELEQYFDKINQTLPGHVGIN
jgi:membrane protein required for colicin V production